MTSRNGTARPIPRIESLRIRNYRVLGDVQLKKLTPLTVLIGPNGSGKSTIFDAFAFLSECVSTGLAGAMAQRGGMRDLRSRGRSGEISFELKYREHRGKEAGPLITYQLDIGEESGQPIVERERLSWTPRRRQGRPRFVLDYQRGDGHAIQGMDPEREGERVSQPLASPDLLALGTLGQFRQHPHAAGLRTFITGWYLSYLAVPWLSRRRESVPAVRLSAAGDNLPNVLQYLWQTDEARLRAIFDDLAKQVPQLEQVTSEELRDGTLLLQLKDKAFNEPILARFASDGTLKLLAYLILLSDPDPPPLIGIEEPENFVHPALLIRLAERCQMAADRSQLLVTSHAPRFLDALEPPQVRVLHRGKDGFTQVRTAADIPGVQEYLFAGGLLGNAWEQRMLDLPSGLVHAH